MNAPPAPPADLVAALAERYDVAALLGRGGMASVYRARDRKHHRDVAIKVLQPELAASIGADRFLKEIEIVAQLTHPHVLPLHDSGEAHGFLFYVMPLIGGGSLRGLLAAGPLGTARAIEIAAPIADALAYAHSVGVYHRDIKPENVLFAHGHPIVADFGIAKAVTTASERHLTRTGLALGTPGYMSPEQAAGFSDLDARTDVYSLAVVVYEMIVGAIPGLWPSEEAVRVGRMLDAPREHRERLASVPAHVEAALVRALAVQTAQRTATPGAFVASLRGEAAPRRSYAPGEVDEIVRRASELEAAQPSGGAMTIGGVEAIAREAGIPTEHVRAAAGALAPAPVAPGVRAAFGGMSAARSVRADGSASVSTKDSKFLGGPQRFSLERVVPGELDERDFAFVVEEIRRAMDNSGIVSQFGKSFSWVSSRGAGKRELEIAVSPRAGETRITVGENMSVLGGQVFGPMMGILCGPGLAALIGLTRLIMPFSDRMVFAIPVWFLASYFATRTTYGFIARKRLRTASEALDRIEACVRECVAAPTALPAAPARSSTARTATPPAARIVRT